jgi:hypothetical protein
MFLQITFLLIATFSLNASGLENTIPGQVYTAEQHLKDIKMLLESLKYKDTEIGFFSFQKKATNQIISVIDKAFEKQLKRVSHHEFLTSSMPTLHTIIYKIKCLTIPPSKRFSFNKAFLSLVEKREKEEERLKKEDRLEKSIEDHKKN